MQDGEKQPSLQLYVRTMQQKGKMLWLPSLSQGTWWIASMFF